MLELLPPLANLSLFIGAALILIITPGPAVLYIIARSVDQGRRAGLASVLGVEIGNSVHVLAAAFGLSAILLSSALAFDVVKYLGAAYLIYLGIKTLRTPVIEDANPLIEPKPLRQIFGQGVVVAILNPKTALFFFAFLPQFVDTSRPVVTQILFLGTVMVVIATISDSLYALLAGTIGGWLRRSRAFLKIQRAVAGGTYIVLGISAAFAGNNKS